MLMALCTLEEFVRLLESQRSLRDLLKRKVFSAQIHKNPFASIDTTGVGQLMQTAVTKGRATREGMKMGICGEHGGDPSSIAFCHKIGLSYVSCSPFRVETA